MQFFIIKTALLYIMIAEQSEAGSVSAGGIAGGVAGAIIGLVLVAFVAVVVIAVLQRVRTSKAQQFNSKPKK